MWRDLCNRGGDGNRSAGTDTELFILQNLLFRFVNTKSLYHGAANSQEKQKIKRG